MAGGKSMLTNGYSSGAKLMAFKLKKGRNIVF